MLFFRRKRAELVEEVPYVKTLKDYHTKNSSSGNIFSRFIGVLKSLFN